MNITRSPVWKLQTPRITNHSPAHDMFGPTQFVSVVFENAHCFLVDPYLAQHDPTLLARFGKVIGKADIDGRNWCWVIARPRVKTNSKGAKRRKRLTCRV